MLLLGNSLTACFTAWQLQASGAPFLWWANSTTLVDDGLPELALLPGPTLSLSHHSQKVWQQIHTQLSMIRVTPFADLATTPGRVEKLKEEALLDALAGQEVAYTPEPMAGLHPKLVLGARYCPAAPQLAPDFGRRIRAALARQPELRTWQSPADLLEQIPPETRKVLVADEHLAEALGVPLHPRRRHRLVWVLAKPMEHPRVPLLLLHRMPRGHTWLWLEAGRVVLVYDGVNDPRQATADTAADAATVAALEGHAMQLLPSLKALKLAQPQVMTETDWYMPDKLPYLGPWELPQEHEAWCKRDIDVFLAGGAGGRSALYAPALGEKLAELGMAEDFLHSPLAPKTTRTATDAPESLQFMEPQVEIRPEEQAETPPETQMATTQLAETPAQNTAATPQMAQGPEIKRMEEVRMVGPESGIRGTLQERSRKPKIQTAPVGGKV